MAVLSSLATALKLLAVDPQALQQYIQDPDASAKILGLKGAARDAFISREPAQIQAAILAERGVDIAEVSSNLETGLAEDDHVVIIIIV